MRFVIASTDEVLETRSEPELDYPVYTLELLEDSGNLRPPTPTGSQSDSDPELELEPRLSLPASEEEERPPTPGGAFEVELEPHAPSPSHRPSPLPPPPSPTGARDFPSPPPLYLSPPLLPQYPTYDNTPKTPGRNREELYQPVGVRSSLRTAMHSPFWSSFISVSPHAGNAIPRTPGRDVNPMSPLSEASELDLNTSLWQRARWQQHSHPTGVRSADSSPHRSLPSGSETPNSCRSPQQSNFSSDVLRIREKKERLLYKRRLALMHRNNYTTDNQSHGPPRGEIRARVKKPLQGLENRLEEQVASDQRATGHRKALYPCRNKRLHARQFTPRSRRRERLLIDAVWTKGVNMEEVGHLKATYERMLQHDHAHHWLKRTHWVPHPHILY